MQWLFYLLYPAVFTSEGSLQCSALLQPQVMKLCSSTEYPQMDKTQYNTLHQPLNFFFFCKSVIVLLMACHGKHPKAI